jgi:hypothetical protein
MTALQSIIKEAKNLRSKYPKRFSKWTDYVKQASAIYANKHKGKSPVGKKKIVKKKVAKKKVVKKEIGKKRIVKKSISKKPSEKVILKKVHSAKKSSKNLFNKLDKLDEAQHEHMGKKMGAINQLALKHYEDVINKINKVEKHIFEYNKLLKDKKYNLHNTKSFKNHLNNAKKYLKELKTQKSELKKLL